MLSDVSVLSWPIEMGLIYANLRLAVSKKKVDTHNLIVACKVISRI